MFFERSVSRALFAATAAALVLGGSVASAQGPGPRGPGGPGPQAGDQPRESRLIRFLDTNGDGKLTMDEITAEQKRLIAAADVDGDGKLSPEEFRRRGRLFMQLRTTTLFDLLDANGDKVLTADELAAPSARWFARYDANGDKSLESEELPQRRHGRRGRHRGMPGPR